MADEAAIVTVDRKYLAWLASEGRGVSSETIFQVMTGIPFQQYSTPCDPSDFGRCFSLLMRFPEWRPRLQEVADRFPKWQPLVDSWSEMETLYLEELPNGTAPKLYELMKKLLKD